MKMVHSGLGAPVFSRQAWTLIGSTTPTEWKDTINVKHHPSRGAGRLAGRLACAGPGHPRRGFRETRGSLGRLPVAVRRLCRAGGADARWLGDPAGNRRASPPASRRSCVSANSSMSPTSSGPRTTSWSCSRAELEPLKAQAEHPRRAVHVGHQGQEPGRPVRLCPGQGTEARQAQGPRLVGRHQGPEQGARHGAGGLQLLGLRRRTRHGHLQGRHAAPARARKSSASEASPASVRPDGRAHGSARPGTATTTRFCTIAARRAPSGRRCPKSIAGRTIYGARFADDNNTVYALVTDAARTRPGLPDRPQGRHAHQAGGPTLTLMSAVHVRRPGRHSVRRDLRRGQARRSSTSTRTRNGRSCTRA